MTDVIRWGLERTRRQRRTGEAYWRSHLGAAPTWALEAELERRGDKPESDRVVRLPGLVLDPIDGRMTWRGDEYAVGGRQMEVLYCLALARVQGFRRLRRAVIGERVWHGFDEKTARQNVNMQIHDLRKRFPGLLDSVKVGLTAAYGLVLDEPVVAVDGVA